MPSNNRIVLAAAGSKKTGSIVEDVVGVSSSNVLVTTYTNENTAQLKQRIANALGGVMPVNIYVSSWFRFLLADCVKPYQNAIVDTNEIRSVNFHSDRPRYVGVADGKRYFIDSNKDIYRDATSDFVVRVNANTDGAVIRRLEMAFDYIFVDEVQDLVGYDLELLKLLLKSDIRITLVGDTRQYTYRTNNSRKNNKYQGFGMHDWCNEMKESGLVEIEERTHSYRCNQAICDFADSLYPDLPNTTSLNTEVTGHDGIHEISDDEVHSYVERYKPIILRWDKRRDTLGYEAINFGASKGSTYDRVLIFPTSNMKKFLRTRNPEDAGDLSKFYVAVTRAKYSVAFVV